MVQKEGVTNNTTRIDVPLIQRPAGKEFTAVTQEDYENLSSDHLPADEDPWIIYPWARFSLDDIP